MCVDILDISRYTWYILFWILPASVICWNFNPEFVPCVVDPVYTYQLNNKFPVLTVCFKFINSLEKIVFRCSYKKS